METDEVSGGPEKTESGRAPGFQLPAGRVRRIIAIGDIQRTTVPERLIARRQNDRHRAAIVEAIVEEAPDLILFLGDLVADGSRERDWRFFDQLVDPILRAGIPAIAIPGNHDYGRRGSTNALDQFFARFPQQRRAFPEVIHLGPVACIALDSNVGRIGPESARAQSEAFRAIVTELDRNPEIGCVVVCSHHPPFSESALRAEQFVVQELTRPFLEIATTGLFLSGHVHSYERFSQAHKTFVVTGGGGGPRRAVRAGLARHEATVEYAGDRFRPFHFLRLEVTDSSILGEMVMLREDRSRIFPFGASDLTGFDVGDRFTVPLGDQSG